MLTDFPEIAVRLRAFRLRAQTFSEIPGFRALPLGPPSAVGSSKLNSNKYPAHDFV
jgi:hypothetical protein